MHLWYHCYKKEKNRKRLQVHQTEATMIASWTIDWERAHLRKLLTLQFINERVLNFNVFVIYLLALLNKSKVVLNTTLINESDRDHQ